MSEETCWFDAVGDRLEAEGFDPGQIFEFHGEFAGITEDGGVVATNMKPGVAPRSWLQIRKLFVKHRGEVFEKSPRALAFHLVLGDGSRIKFY